jgi:hypothetical protein
MMRGKVRGFEELRIHRDQPAQESKILGNSVGAVHGARGFHRTSEVFLFAMASRWSLFSPNLASIDTEILSGQEAGLVTALAEERTMSEDAPIFLTGTIHPNDAAPFCREGVEYVIYTEPVPFQLRLRASGPDLERRLAVAASARERVVMRGVFRRHPQPGWDYVEVLAIDPVARYVACTSSRRRRHAGDPDGPGPEGGSPGLLGPGYAGALA